MATPPDYDHIVAAAAIRANVTVAKDDLKKIKGCQPGTTLAKWIEQNLTTDTLLSHEESSFSKHIVGNAGVRSKHTEDIDTGNVPLHEEELLAAIANLDASTAALNRESQVLQNQQALVERRNDEYLRSKRSGQTFADEIAQRNSNEVQRLRSEIGEMQDEIEGLFRTSEATIEKASKRIPSMITELMNSHDRTLDDLDGQELAGASSLQARSTRLENIERLTATLSDMIAEEIQVKLDRVYMESLQQATAPVNANQADAAEDAKNLEEDLRSLYSDIPDVAKMFVAQRYEEPLIRAVHIEEKQEMELASLQAGIITAQLSGLTADLDHLVSRLQAFHSYHCAIQSMKASYRQTSTSATTTSSSPRKPKSQPPQQPGPALEVLLRHFGLPDLSSAEAHISIESKVAQLRESGRGLSENFRIDSQRTLDARRKIVEALIMSVDEQGNDAACRLEALEAKLAALRAQVEAVNSAAAGEDLRKQRSFVTRWS